MASIALYSLSLQQAVYLLAALSALAGGAYWWQRVRCRRGLDALTNAHPLYFKQIQQAAADLKFSGRPVAELFGRESVVRLPNRQFGLGLILAPSLNTEIVRERFQDFDGVLAGKRVPYLVRSSWRGRKEEALRISQGALHHDGRLCPTVSQLLGDKRLQRAHSHELLIELAACLAALHERKGSDDQPLYHGLLLPRAVRASLDVNRRLCSVALVDAGLLYAIGREQFVNRWQELEQHRLPIDSRRARGWRAHRQMLAPEIFDPELGEVGIPADIFSFACLAILLFTGKASIQRSEVDWNAVPCQWHGFLQKALSTDPLKRPRSLKGLAAMLMDRDLASVAHRERDLSLSLEAVQTERFAKALSSLPPMERGMEFLQQRRWGAARRCLTQALEDQPNDPKRLVNLAIACYELGDVDAAEELMVRAKELDPVVAKGFREHVAQRV